MANPQDLSYYWTAGQVQPPTAVASSSSSQSVNEPSVEGPARKKRRKDDNDLYFRSDAEVWDLEDMEILGKWHNFQLPQALITVLKLHLRLTGLLRLIRITMLPLSGINKPESLYFASTASMTSKTTVNTHTGGQEPKITMAPQICCAPQRDAMFDAVSARQIRTRLT